jgi:hypothetical protein
MNRRMAAVLSGVLLLGLSVTSHAQHWDSTYLPLYGTVEDSIRRAGNVLKTMGGEGRLRQSLSSVEMVWEPPERTIVHMLSMTPWRKVEVRDVYFVPPDAALRLSCTTFDDYPAATTLCNEVKRRYLQGR